MIDIYAIPVPFMDAVKLNKEGDTVQNRGTTFKVGLHGQPIEIRTFEERDSFKETARFSTGVVRREIINNDKYEAQKQTITISTPGEFPSYTLTQDAGGISFSKQDKASAKPTPIEYKDYITAANAIIGSHDPQFVTDLTTVLAKQKAGNLSNLTPATNDRLQLTSASLNILTDGKASLMREIGPHGRVLAAYVGKEPLMYPPADTSRVDTQTVWAGNGFDGRIKDILQKTLPKNEAAALLDALSAGRLSLRVEQANNGELCSAMLAGAKKDEKSQCHKR